MNSYYLGNKSYALLKLSLSFQNGKYLVSAGNVSFKRHGFIGYFIGVVFYQRVPYSRQKSYKYIIILGIYFQLLYLIYCTAHISFQLFPIALKNQTHTAVRHYWKHLRITRDRLDIEDVGDGGIQRMSEIHIYPLHLKALILEYQRLILSSGFSRRQILFSAYYKRHISYRSLPQLLTVLIKPSF